MPTRRSRPFTVFNVVAARPNFPKVAPIDRAMRARPDRFRPVLVHTGQHYDFPMSDVFLRDLGMPAPDHHLGIGSGNHGEQTAEALKRFEALLLDKRPDLVLVVGDVNSTLACALAASKLCIPVAHVEAGLRSFDRSMPEEINRVVTDVLSDLLFVTEPAGLAHLKREGFAKKSVHLVGDVMIDALRLVLPVARASGVRAGMGLQHGEFALLTMHRPANVDDRARLARLLDGIEEVAGKIPVVFPVHPRTAKRLEEFGLADRLRGMRGLLAIEPLGYVDFLSLLDAARFAVTDSGGVPEECTFLGVPCLTLRGTTERPATVKHGINVLVDDSRKKLVAAASRVLKTSGKRKAPPRGWDGKAAGRIVDIVYRFLRARAESAA